MTGPFDRALQNRELRYAAIEYASRYGQPGSAGFRSAWVAFHQQARAREAPRSTTPARTGGGRPRSDDPKPADLTCRVLNAAVKRAMRIDGTAMANVQLIQPRTEALHLTAHHGFSEEFLNFFKIVDDTTSACGSALERGTPVMISDITNSAVFARTLSLQVMLRTGSRAVASLPIRSPTGRVIAMLSTHHTEPTTWTDRRLLGLGDLCKSTGVLLHHILQTADARPGQESPAQAETPTSG